MEHHQLPNSSHLGLSLDPRSQGTPSSPSPGQEPESPPPAPGTSGCQLPQLGPGCREGSGCGSPRGAAPWGRGTAYFRGTRVSQLGDAALEGMQEGSQPQAKWLLSLL